jgi:Fe-S cluster biogenesis protein NfuA
MSQEQLLQVTNDGGDSVTLQLEASSPVTVRLMIDGGCSCKHGHATENRPGSYIDSDLGGSRS